MVPMRDGVRLHTVIVVPSGAKDAPILLTRTPYDASHRTARNDSPHMLAVLPQADEVFVRGGYIRVFQDVRGKYASEGEYLMTRPVRGPLNPATTDHVTDAWDTIDWLVKNTAGIERPGGHDRLVLRRLHGGDGAARSAPGAEGGRAGEPHGGRMDGRRLVPLRRLPPGQSRLHRLPDHPQRRRRSRSARRLRRLRGVPPRRFGRRLRPRPRSGSTALGAENLSNTPPTTPSGRARRWTNWWPSGRRRCPPCGFRACGTRRICGAPSTATWP